MLGVIGGYYLKLFGLVADPKTMSARFASVPRVLCDAHPLL